MTIFVDTSAFYALADKKDKHHLKAKEYYLQKFKPSLFVTSDYVFVESWILIWHKLGRQAARTFWETMRSGIIPLKYVTPVDLERAWEIFNKYYDQNFSLIDCTSFALMERLRIWNAFVFDVHFSVFRIKDQKTINCQPI